MYEQKRVDYSMDLNVFFSATEEFLRCGHPELKIHINLTLFKIGFYRVVLIEWNLFEKKQNNLVQNNSGKNKALSIQCSFFSWLIVNKPQTALLYYCFSFLARIFQKCRILSTFIHKWPFLKKIFTKWRIVSFSENNDESLKLKMKHLV